ncbi:MAG TPA: DUF255 domain-containing protein [Candidatus Obscuribacterales bacterium]
MFTNSLSASRHGRPVFERPLLRTTIASALAFTAAAFVLAQSATAQDKKEAAQDKKEAAQGKKEAFAGRKAGTMTRAKDGHGSAINWQSWSDDIFRRAKRENKLVLLDLEAVWCHWCHVMDHKTYSNPGVAKLLNERFIAVKVDQDSRPDLSNKYEEYGWPATIIFNSEGQELVKRSGYIAAPDMSKLLKRLIANPIVEETTAKIQFTDHDALPESLRKELGDKHVEGYDSEKGGWLTQHKFLDEDSLEYSLLRLKEGDAGAQERVTQTLSAHQRLIDPVWGGVYQYSTYGDWEHPHFEKIMHTQSECLRIYALAYMVLNDPLYLKAAEKIASYLENFLMSPEGAFYTSQDADLKPGEHSQEYFALSDEKRRAQGIPRVDKHIYARENGWAINSFAYLYMASGKEKYLSEAVKAADWIIANRSLEDGGFKHDAVDKGGPFLGDTLAMGRAFLSLYQATADRHWLKRAESAARYIDKNFATNSEGKPTAGFLTSKARANVLPEPDPLMEENQVLARFTNLLYHYTGDSQFQKMSKHAMRYLATPEIARKRRILVAGTLLADYELSHAPSHITVVGSKGDAGAKDLFMAAIRAPRVYRRIDWLDRKEGNLPNLDVDFPDLGKPAAFVCSGNRCSSPAYKPDQISVLLERISK